MPFMSHSFLYHCNPVCTMAVHPTSSVVSQWQRMRYGRRPKGDGNDEEIYASFIRVTLQFHSYYETQGNHVQRLNNDDEDDAIFTTEIKKVSKW